MLNPQPIPPIGGKVFGDLPKDDCQANSSHKTKLHVRFPEVDWIKAIGVSTVLLIHALPNTYGGHEITLIDEWIGQATHFAVPGFLASSGFLFASSSTNKDLQTMRQRLVRLLLPYLLFSVVAWFHALLWSHMGQGIDETPFVQKMFLFSTMGHYYYVFLIVCYVVCTPFLSRIPDGKFQSLVLLALAYQFGNELHIIGPVGWSLFWHIRNPLRTFASFLLGWMVFEKHGLIMEEAKRRRRQWTFFLCVLNAIGGLTIAFLDLWSTFRLLAGVVQNYLTLGLIMMSTAGRSSTPYFVEWMSAASYPIYLVHFFFMHPVLTACPPEPGTFEPMRIMIVWASGLGGSVVFLGVSRWMLGEPTSRKYLG